MNNREYICQNVSDLLAEMLDIVELELDGFTHHFQGYLEKSTHEEKAIQRWHKLTLELRVYEFGVMMEQKGKIQMIVTFLAILELMKTGELTVMQEHTFDDMLITSRI